MSPAEAEVFMSMKEHLKALSFGTRGGGRTHCHAHMKVVFGQKKKLQSTFLVFVIGNIIHSTLKILKIRTGSSRNKYANPQTVQDYIQLSVCSRVSQS